MSINQQTTRIERHALLEWVPLNFMRVSPLVQRELNPARVNRIVVNFDLEQLGTFTLSERGGAFNIIDGQHRWEALRAKGYENSEIQCWVYRGLTEAEEAEKFLKLNDALAVNAFAKFKVGVQAGRPEECDIHRIVRNAGCRVALDAAENSIHAVGTLMRVYRQTGSDNLRRTLQVVYNAYEHFGLAAVVMDGVSLMLHRYGDQLDDATFIQRLSQGARGGINNLRQRAEQHHQKLGNQKRHCYAAAAVDIVNNNRPKGASKLPSWWREENVRAA